MTLSEWFLVGCTVSLVATLIDRWAWRRGFKAGEVRKHRDFVDAFRKRGMLP